MDAENLALYNSSNTQVIEDLSAIFPRIGIAILSDGFIVEAINSGDLSGFVVSSKEGDVGRVLKFETEEQLEGFDGVEASIHEISHEDVPGVWNFPAFVEKFK
jgi:hypothetical protein